MFKKLFITLLLVNIVNSSSTQRVITPTQRVNTKIKRILQNSFKPIPCNPGTNRTSCVCPNINCLKYNEKIDGCRPINCWKWNTIKQNCENAGKEFLPALVLQAIPITGVFGSGFGNMGRWDIFGTYMIVIFGGCTFICFCGIGCSCIFKNSEDTETWVKLGTNCGGCLLSLLIVVLWIWGIVVIANKEVEAPWNDWEGNEIMCPLIGK